MQLGNIESGTTLDFGFTTQQLDGTPITLAGSPSVAVYKGNSATETNVGITLTVDHDSRTGSHHVRILTADAFYATGNDYRVVLIAGTVDGTSVAGSVLAHFSIENRHSHANLKKVNDDSNVTDNIETGFTVAPGDAGGLPTVDANNRVGGIQGTKNRFDDLNDLSQSQSQSAATTALNTYDPPTKAELDAAESNIVAAVNAVNTGAARYITILTPVGYEIPDSGSVTVPIEVRTFDGDGEPVDIDAAANPTIAIYRASDDTDLSAALSAISKVETGRWRCTYTVTSADAVEPLRIDASGAINSTTRKTSAYPTVTDAVAVDYTAADRARDDAAKAAIDALNNFNPATDTVAITAASEDAVVAKVFGQALSGIGSADTVGAIIKDLADGGRLDVIFDSIKAVTDLLNAAQSEPSGVPAMNETPLTKLAYLFMALRNGVEVTASKKTFHDDAGNGEWAKALSDDGATYTEAEAAAP